MLWLLLPFHVPAVLSIGYLARVVSGRRTVGLLGAFLYLLYPTVFNHGVHIGTDLLHAQLAVTAVACTIAWTRTRLISWACAALLLWPIVQLTRPTFFPVVLVLPFALWVTIDRLRDLRWSLALLAMSVVVPLTFAVKNRIDYGVLTPSFAGLENVHRYLVPSINAVRRDAEEPDALMMHLWHEERDLKAGADPEYVAMKLYEPVPVPVCFAENYRILMQRDISFVKSNLVWLLRVFRANVSDELLIPPTWPFGPSGDIRDGLLRKAQKGALLLVMLGLVLGWVNGPRNHVLFAAAITGLVLVPAFLIWWVGDRVRLPVDLVMVPFIAAAVTDGVVLAGMAVLAVVVYAPFRLLHLSTVYLYTVGALVLIVTVFLLFRRERAAPVSDLSIPTGPGE
ncbi:MAG: hypothetical protein V1929_12735 [bacterium]